MISNPKALQADIVTLKVDAIVNAANKTLLGGGGVDGAIHSAAGGDLFEHCRILGGCETGQSKLTPGFNLPAKYIIHTVGPIWEGGDKYEPELLKSCYESSLHIAEGHDDIETIAFPAISCGIFGYPIQQAASVAVNTTVDFLHKVNSNLQVTFVCFSKEDLNIYLAKLSEFK